MRHRYLLPLLVALLTAAPVSAQTALPPAVQAYDAPVAGARSPRNANYVIEARLDAQAKTVSGRLTLSWRNITAATATDLRLHLYWNAWRNQRSTWLTERRRARMPAIPVNKIGTGSIDITRLALRTSGGELSDVTRRMEFIAPDDGNQDDRTLVRIPLDSPVPPLGTVTLDVEWTARIPRGILRAGYIGDYFLLAHWFPKIGVLEDAGWKARQFHAATEFYADFGTYDVRLTVPAAFLLGATGTEVSRINNRDGTVTHRYVAEDVHDFAVAASPDFQVITSRFEEPGLPAADIRLLILPEHAAQAARYISATQTALRLFQGWAGPYPYGHITVVDPAYQSVTAAMEYPTLFTTVSRWLFPARVTAPQPDAITIHEAAHQFWQGIIATNETDHAWMDEGLTVYLTAKAMEQEYPPTPLLTRFFGGLVPWVIDEITLRRDTDGNRLPGFRPIAATADTPATPTYRYWPATANLISYNKTSLWLHMLEREIGWPAMQRGLRAYFEEWKFRHPQPEHFFAAMNNAAGRDLTPFFDGVHRSAATLDYAVHDLRTDQADGGFDTTVILARLGELKMPVNFKVTFADGSTATDRWDGNERHATFSFRRPARAVAAEVDPERKLLLDINLTNNSRAASPRGAEAARKWSLKWLVWLQDLMLTYALFA